jgi:hypothetical protein
MSAILERKMPVFQLKQEPESLLQALRDLEIVPLTPESVAAYQQQVIKDRTVPILSDTAKFVFQRLNRFEDRLQTKMRVRMPNPWDLLVFTSIHNKWFLEALNLFMDKYHPGIWDKVEAHKYCQHFEVPAFVHETMSAVLKKLPRARFVIHYYFDDPFLEVIDGQEQYFIEAWYEHSYNAQRLA